MRYPSLIPIYAIVPLAALVSALFFLLLESSAVFKSGAVELGGAIAAFFIILTALIKWYNQLEKRKLSMDREERKLLTIEKINNVARLAASYLVSEANSRNEDLDQLYPDHLASLKSLYRDAGEEQLEELENAFEAETKLQVHPVLGLKSWSPPGRKPDPAKNLSTN